MDADAKANAPLAQEYDISSFPTIKFFSKDNKEGEAYEGGRDERDFVDYLNEKCGTKRAVGGGLNDEVHAPCSKNVIIVYLPSSRLGAFQNSTNSQASSSLRLPVHVLHFWMRRLRSRKWPVQLHNTIFVSCRRWLTALKNTSRKSLHGQLS